jgi:chemotaxis response regulator CheB
MRIILIDYEWNGLGLLKKMIQTVDPEIEIAVKFQNPPEAIPTILAVKPDIVVLDLEMPYINGIDMIRMLAYTKCYFLVVTGGDASQLINPRLCN